MNFRCKFRQRRSIRCLRFSIAVQNFCDLATFSFDFCILYAECLPYFYFRFVWPTDLETIPHASTPTSIILTRFEVDMTIHCPVIAFLSADTSRNLVALTFALFTLNSWRTWRVTWPTLPPSLKTLRLSVFELRVITFPIGYHWKCVRGHCACVESRDPWVGCQNNYIFWNPDPDLPIHCTVQLLLGYDRRRLRKLISCPSGVVKLGRRHDGSRIVVSVDACESGSTVQFSTHMFVHRFGMGSMRRSG